MFFFVFGWKGVLFWKAGVRFAEVSFACAFAFCLLMVVERFRSPLPTSVFVALMVHPFIERSFHGHRHQKSSVWLVSMNSKHMCRAVCSSMLVNSFGLHTSTFCEAEFGYCVQLVVQFDNRSRQCDLRQLPNLLVRQSIYNPTL